MLHIEKNELPHEVLVRTFKENLLLFLAIYLVTLVMLGMHVIALFLKKQQIDGSHFLAKNYLLKLNQIMGNCCNFNCILHRIVGFEMLFMTFVRKLQVNERNVPHRSMIMASYPIIIRNVLSPNWYLLPSAFNESSNLEVI